MVESNVAQALERCQSAIDAYLPAHSSLAGRLAELRARLREGRLQLAVLGQFKRGKSTFLNSLLGAAYLPSAVIPVTALPTFIAWGHERLVRVSYLETGKVQEFRATDAASVRDLVHRFVAEEANPENRLGVSRVDILLPAAILERGIVLIDTPGVGSTHRHNTDAALNVLPECDAALFIVSVDPPITEGEIEYLRQIRPRVTRLFFILNKTDLVDLAEQNQARDFMHKTLEKSGLIARDTEIFAVSARSGLVARQKNDLAAFAESGMAAVEDYLSRFLTLEKTRSLENAAAMKASAILAEAAGQLDLGLRTLKLPLETLDEKHRMFEELIKPIEARRLVTRDLLRGERGRIVATLEERAERLRDRARDRLFAVVDALGDGVELDHFEQRAAATLPPAITDFFDEFREEMTEFFVKQSEATLGAHRERIGEHVAAVRQTAADLFDLTFSRIDETETFRLAQEPYWLSQRWNTTLIPDLSPLVDRMLTKQMRRKRIETRIKAQIDELIVRNVENLRWSILRGIDETFARATSALEGRLDEAVAVARTAIANAQNLRASQGGQVEAEIVRLLSGTAAIADARAVLSSTNKLAAA